PETESRLLEAARAAGHAGDLQRTVPLVELETEQALLHGLEPPRERLAELVDQARARGGLAGWVAVRLAACAALCGVEADWATPDHGPYALVAASDWRGAADAFGAMGWGYDRALFLSFCEDEDALVEALGTARMLDAEPLARRTIERLREGGHRVPAGPRDSTRANPAGLTARQLEVLTLVAEGLTNAEIAERLVVSQRTAEHHVAAVLQKLGAPTRRDAARRAAELGLV
ncbi:MAG: LuxR C-terminal-related transcriptional regulator, partial [Gaiella sp.]